MNPSFSKKTEDGSVTLKSVTTVVSLARICAGIFLALVLIVYMYHFLVSIIRGSDIRFGTSLGPFALTWTLGMIVFASVEMICKQKIESLSGTVRSIWSYSPSIFFLAFVVTESLAYGAIHSMNYNIGMFFAILALASWGSLALSSYTALKK